jgi:hypothetical protein
LRDFPILRFRAPVGKRASAIKLALPIERAAVAMARLNDRRWISLPYREARASRS